MLTSLINNFKIKFENNDTEVFKQNKTCCKLPEMKPDTFERSSKSVKELSFKGKSELPVKKIEQLLKQTIEKIISTPEPKEKYNIWVKTGKKLESFIKELFNSKKLNETSKEERKSFLNDLVHEQRPPLTRIQIPLSGAKKIINPIPLPENYKEIYEKEAAELIDIYKRYQFFIDSGIYKSDKALPAILGLAMDLIKGKTNKITVEGVELLETTKLNLKNTEIYSIFSNILQNAAKYSKEKGNIKIKFSLGKDAKNQSVLNFSVQDNGIGIPADQFEKVLEGVRASNTGNIPGTGYGLHRVNRILENAGSNIIIKSKEGKGTRITCPIPILAAPERQV
jgi:signal transduction histidine kinase